MASKRWPKLKFIKIFSEEEEQCYKGSIIHRIVPKGWIQGGNILASKGSGQFGTGGRSSFAEAEFPDESFAIKHDARGIIGMANNGPHTNQSQFYITLEAKSYMDKKYVAFGRVIRGSKVLDEIELKPTFTERPVKTISIVACGQI